VNSAEGNQFFRLRLPSFTSIGETSPVDGETGVAVIRETIVHFTAPLATNTVITTDNFYAGYGGQRLLSRVELSTDRRKATLFYLEPLPGSTRIYAVFDGTGLTDELGRPLDGQIAGWNATVDLTHAVSVYSANDKACYRGLAIANNGTANFLYATDLHNNKVDVFDATFAKRIDGWINPAAFSQAPQFTFSNVGRVVSLRGPGQISFDTSVFKEFSILEKLKAQFRAEALNISNTPTFYGPNTTFTNPQFGIITSQANYPRLIQMGVRFYK
jgi:hypothetical protein